MDINKSKKLLLRIAVLYWLLAIMIYAVGHDQFRYVDQASEALTPSAVICDLTDGVEVGQKLRAPANRIDKLELLAATYGRENPGTIIVALSDADGHELARATADAAVFGNGEYTSIELEQPLTGHKGEELMLSVTSENCKPGEALALYAGNVVSTGRFEIEKNLDADDNFTLNHEIGQGMLCAKLIGVDELNFYKTYWVIVAGAFLLAALVCVYWWKKAMRGQNNPLVMVCTLLTKYSFMLRQLVSRDFKTKYKRSVLGMFWSFLNPLLTMAVQYVVFSTLFKSNIENYPVYLLCGIVFMNFFSEAVGMCMTSITSNAALIKKVYMPKYIYPVSRVISSLVNFIFAIIPLFIVMLVSGTAFRASLLLLVFDILCMLGFITGMGLMMSTAMTFFQDTQFLWGVVNMMWFYFTPIFYPESIIPENLLGIYHLNPMYQFITFARTCIISGVSPEPIAYLWCIVASVLVLMLGVLVFKRHQDKFVLNL